VLAFLPPALAVHPARALKAIIGFVSYQRKNECKQLTGRSVPKTCP
jgi:hypothetical protein